MPVHRRCFIFLFVLSKNTASGTSARERWRSINPLRFIFYHPRSTDCLKRKLRVCEQANNIEASRVTVARPSTFCKMDIFLILQVFTSRENSDRKTIVSHVLNAFQGYEKCELLFPLQVFAANSDRDTIVSHVLTPRFRARYVRFVVLTWQRHISMRVELYGCAAS